MRIEHWFYTLPLRLRSLFQRRRVEKDLNEELQYHLEQRIEVEKARGLGTDEARYAALRAMQGLEQRKEECRDARRVNVIENAVRDVRYALRMLKKSPVFAIVAVLSLALGIGTNTAIFSLIDALLLRPLPVPESERLVRIEANTGGPRAINYFTYTLFERVRDRNSVFSGTFTWADHRFQMRSGTDMVHVNGALASGDYFRTFGVSPQIGRTFTVDDDHPDGGKNGPVTVISDAFWESQFQRNPGVIGAGITLDGVRFTIIGVMPRSFFGADVGTRPQIWAPLSLVGRIDDPGCISSRSCWWLVPMARLKPGISLQEAQGQLKVLSPRIMRDALPLNWDPSGQKKFLQWQLHATSGTNGWTVLRHQFSNPLAVLMILVAVVLLIACANMANLLLERSALRQREIAVRLAIGAGRWRITRQLLTESVLLSLMGGVAALMFAVWSTRLLVAFLASTQRASVMEQDIHLDLQPDWRIVLFTFLVAVGCGLLFGLSPALRATRLGISASLKERTHNLQGAAGRIGIGRVILGLQAALSVLLVAGAGLFAGSLWHLATLNPGFNPKNVAMIGLDTDKRLEKGPALTNLYSRILERADAIPGVRSASLFWITPLSEGGWDNFVTVPGKADVSQDQRDTFMNLVGPRFFETMQIPLLAGREFNRADTLTSEKVAIINEIAARRFFPKQNAIGFRVSIPQDLPGSAGGDKGLVLRIVGVVGNIKYLDLHEPEPPELYIPYTQKADGVPSMNVALRTDTTLETIYPAFRAIVRDVAPDVPVGRVKTMQGQVDDSLGSERLMACLSVFFGILALALTSIGLYGVLAYGVARRTGEIGVRMALGAGRSNVIWLVVRETMSYVGIGMAAGVIAVLATSRLVASLLYGIRPNDAGNLVLAVLTFLLVGAMAAYFPARRASKLDPLQALREE